MDILPTLMQANDPSRPLHERIGLMETLLHRSAEMDGDAREAYERIKADILRRIQDCYNPAHSPR